MRRLLPILVIAALLAAPVAGGAAALLPSVGTVVSNTLTAQFVVRAAPSGGEGGTILVPPEPPIQPPVEPPIKPPAVIELADVEGYWGQTCIRKLVELGVITGYPDGTFRPNEPVTRAEATKMMVTALRLSTEASLKIFADDVPEWARPYVTAGFCAGVVIGYNDGTFRADRLVSRAEYTLMAVRAWPQDVVGALIFADQIPPWAADAIKIAVGAGLVKGYPDGTFRPDCFVTRGEAAVIICRALHLP